jgi:hypothetical protein
MQDAWKQQNQRERPNPETASLVRHELALRTKPPRDSKLLTALVVEQFRPALRQSAQEFYQAAPGLWIMRDDVARRFGGRDDGRFIGYSRDWMEVWAHPRTKDPVAGRIRYKRAKSGGHRRYCGPDSKAQLEK